MCHWYVVFETHFGVYVSFKECCSNCIRRQQCLSPDCEQVGNRPIEAHSRKTLVDSAHDQVWANQGQSCWDHLEPSRPWHQNSFSWQTQNALLHVEHAFGWWQDGRTAISQSNPSRLEQTDHKRNLQCFIFQFFFDPARAAQHCEESGSTCLLEQHRYDARSRVYNMQRSCITAGLEPTSSSWVWFVLVRQDVDGFDDSGRYDLVCCHVEDWARPWIYWMSQRFGPIVSAHTCWPPEKIQLPEFVSQSW